MWLSDLKKLRSVVDSVMDQPKVQYVYLSSMVEKGNLVKHCEFKLPRKRTDKMVYIIGSGVLMISRDSEKPQLAEFRSFNPALIASSCCAISWSIRSA